MGAFGGILGLGGGASGTSFSGPQAAGQIGTINSDEINNSYAGTQQSMGAQQQLLQALQNQNGLANQSQVYGQLQGVANGTGPNPAQAQYNANIQNLAGQQAGAIASTKGISPALAAQLASQQGSAAMQNAAAQGAANQATQQLGAIGQAANIAGQQASNQIGQTNANTQAQQAEQQNILGAANQSNVNAVNMQSNINSANAGLANTQLQGQQGLVGGVTKSLGLGSSLFADGGDVGAPAPAAFSFSAGSGPQSKFGQFLAAQQAGASTSGSPGMMQFAAGPSSFSKGIGGNLESSGSGPSSKLPDISPGANEGDMAGGAGDTAGAADAGGTGDLALLAAAKGGMAPDFRGGGNVVARAPSQRAVKSGNSYANDKIPAVLSEGEVVIPRNVMQSPDPIGGAAKFVQAVLAKRKR